MTEYEPWNPTTADVRERYTDWYDGVNAPPVDVSGAEFDRWLELHDDEVAKATEKRIIKSLEAELEAHRAGKETKLNMESLPSIASDLDDVIWFIQEGNK